MTYRMNCTDVRPRLDALVLGELSRDQADALLRHIEGCAGCAGAKAEAEKLFAALRSMPVPPMRSGFAEAALARAVAHGESRRPQRHVGQGPQGHPMAAGRWRRPAAWLGALAAGILAFAVLGPSRLPEPPITSPETAPLRLALYDPREIAIAIDAGEAVVGARLTVRVTGGISLFGFGDARELHWESDLDAGTNLLPLPVIAHSLEQGLLTAVVEHGDSVHRIEIAFQPDQLGPDSGRESRP
jgi:hypothetical protein